MTAYRDTEPLGLDGTMTDAEMLDSTRRYPRTMYGANGAYPYDAQYAAAIEGPDGVRGVTYELVRIIVVAAIVGALAVAIL